MTKVAVYGSLRQGMGNHSLLAGQQLVSCTMTKEPFVMYTLGGFPMISLYGKKVSPITVEVYDVDEACLERLNRLEGFYGKGDRNFYDRSEIETADGLTALIYHIEDRTMSDDRIVESGDWVEYYSALHHGRKHVGW